MAPLSRLLSLTVLLSFLFSLAGHSIFLRTEAVKQCGRMRVLRNAQRWLQNIGLPFIQVDQIGFTNLRAESKIEYWSECHVSEDFEVS
jgi:hypothetical protein